MIKFINREELIYICEKPEAIVSACSDEDDKILFVTMTVKSECESFTIQIEPKYLDYYIDLFKDAKRLCDAVSDKKYE